MRDTGPPGASADETTEVPGALAVGPSISGRPRWLRMALGLLRWIVYLCLLGFLGFELWQARHGLVPRIRTVGWGTAVVAAIISGVGGLPSYIGWRLLLTALDVRFPWQTAARIYFPAMLTRYLPGGMWPVLVQASRARALGTSPVLLGGAFLASQVLATFAGLVVGTLALGRLAAVDPMWWVLLPGLVSLTIPLAVPVLRERVARLARRVLRRLPASAGVTRLPGSGTLFAATGVMTVGWLIAGLHVTILAVALGTPVTAALPLGVGGFALSVVAGALTVVLPSGLGVRELVLGLAFSALLSGSALVTLVAMSRVLSTVGELVCTAAVVMLARTTTGRQRGAAV